MNLTSLMRNPGWWSKQMKAHKLAFVFVLGSWLLAACGLGTPRLIPTSTPLPSSTYTPAPTSTPTLSPTPVVYDGQWYGTTSAGGRVSFKIEQNGIVSFKVSFSFSTRNGSCDVTSDTSISPSLSIEGHEFDIQIPSLTFAGKFDSATTASGTLDASQNSPRCVGGINVSWTATRE
jgi:hypothetical protein